MDEIEIDEVELEFLETGLESGFDAFGTMIGIPELRDDKHVLPLDLPLLEHFLHRFADLFFGSVAFRSVEQAKSCFQRRLGRDSGCDGVGNECAKAERGDGAGSVVERLSSYSEGRRDLPLFRPPILIRRLRARMQCQDQFGRGEDRVGGRRPVQLGTACIISCEKAAVASVTRVT